MLTTKQSDLSQADMKEKLQDPHTDYLIIDSPQGFIFVHKKNATVFILPKEE